MTNACVSSLHGNRSGVSVPQRLSNLLFGSPSAVRAHGGRHATMSELLLGGKVVRASQKCAPVYQLDEVKGHSLRLPRIWISEPAYDFETGVQCGREFIASYPCDNDPEGIKAFKFGLNYFSEALSYGDPSFACEKIECFRAAEVLFLHAFERGCIDAAVKLGILYQFDLCQGVYWGKEFSSDSEKRIYLNARAVECYSAAADLGDSEALRRLGEMIGTGEGCSKDPHLAFRLYLRAFDAAEVLGDYANRGYAALCIASAFENAEGCPHSFKRAYHWYRIAEDDLSFIVEEGGWHYKKPRSRASLGLKRMRQELVGGY